MLESSAAFSSRSQLENQEMSIGRKAFFRYVAQCLSDSTETMKTLILIALSLIVSVADAEILVSVGPPKIVGQKADIPMEFKNSSDKRVESVRAVTFLLDENGKVVAQATRWIIGGGQVGKSSSELPANTTRTVHFVVPSDKPFATTNLTAKVNLTRILLEGGQILDGKEVQITNVQK
jgi:hypothetical protein